MELPPKHPKMIIFSRKGPMVVGETQHFKVHPHIGIVCPSLPNILWVGACTPKHLLRMPLGGPTTYSQAWRILEDYGWVPRTIFGGPFVIPGFSSPLNSNTPRCRWLQIFQRFLDWYLDGPQRMSFGCFGFGLVLVGIPDAPCMVYIPTFGWFVW